MALTPRELDRSVQSIAYLVPGNSRLSPWGRRMAGAGAHVGISLVLGVVYRCLVRPRMGIPSLLKAAGFGVAVWAVDIKLLAPERMLEEDPSLRLPDHLCWALVVEMCLRRAASNRGGAE
jgi:uncharacterized membrane protein YagU involved in acid resistance